MRVLIVAQARLESRRLPGKVLAPLCGQPMLLHQLDRLRRVETPQRLVVAIPRTEQSLRTLGPTLTRHGYAVACPEVPPDDVLGRFAAVVEAQTGIQAVVRVTGDCPLFDPAVLDRALELFRASQSDYVALAPEWPDGLDLEVLRPEVLLDAHRLASAASDREHVTPFVWRQPERYRQTLLPCPWDLSAHCWSVDDAADLHAVETILSVMWCRYPGGSYGWRDVATFLAAHGRYQRWATGRSRNQSYLTQIGAEVDWHTLRYTQEGPA